MTRSELKQKIRYEIYDNHDEIYEIDIDQIMEMIDEYAASLESVN